MVQSCESTQNSASTSLEETILKLKDSPFRFDIKIKFFTIRVIKHWQKLPREMVDTPFLETLEVRLDRALNNLI